MRNNIIAKSVFIMFAAISLVSCSSDDVLQQNLLIGTWQQVFDDSVVAKEFVQYDFVPESVDVTSQGVCNIITRSSVNHGFVITRGKYVISDFDSNQLYVFLDLDNGHVETRVFELKSLSSKEMTLVLIDSGEILRFRK